MATTSKGVSASYPTHVDINDIHAPTHPDDQYKYSHGLNGVNQPQNNLLVNVLLTTLLLVTIVILVYRVGRRFQAERRHVAAATNPARQAIWATNRWKWLPRLKEHLLYAPLWRNRHNSEIQISSAITFGTLPSRMHTILLLGYFASNLAYCLILPWKSADAPFLVATLRGRSGTLAVLNLIPTILFALRNNPFIWIFHISYDTFNLFHRWLARIVFLEVLAHIAAWLYNTLRVGDWKGAMWIINQAESYKWGLMASIAFLLLTIQTWSPLRHAFYETFLLIHRVLVIHVIIGVYWHLKQHALPQLYWAYIFIAFLAAEYVFRFFRVAYFNTSGLFRGRSITKTTVEALPGEACRLTFHLTRPWTGNPGSHVHVYLPSISFWCSHPFSVAWIEPQPLATESGKLPSSIDDLKFKTTNSTISLVVRARTGMTRSLHTKASFQPNNTLTTWGAIEGPYGGFNSLDSYGTVLLFAGGVGITHQISFVRHLVAGHAGGTAAAQKVVLIWSIRSTDILEWTGQWLDEIMAMRDRKNVLQVIVFVSGRNPDLDTKLLPEGIKVRRGRCNASDVIDAEILDQVGAMVVTVCGPGAFADMVRAAVRRRVSVKNIDFVEESFTY
ncbi:uncharacterized protein BDZ99DRAFT_505158 [Mytilinidion resinicola]|uniref:FAD-binding FR-type domain-containing protein n=1 Tax=Mytilinidion resinicola TaxID=574789 RepID=A0A6A6Z9S8_9PEZI|nr:uncharacterized protein BDZ99DRAFT_505158 [Mytilinidion resinicola]KAF2817449.1 hypothetical protein BDZ99DRAFT_505158 [Mytilinidion resinicola]